MYVFMMMCLICSIDIGFMIFVKLLYFLYVCKKFFLVKILKKIEVFVLFFLEVCVYKMKLFMKLFYLYLK